MLDAASSVSFDLDFELQREVGRERFQSFRIAEDFRARRDGAGQADGFQPWKPKRISQHRGESKRAQGQRGAVAPADARRNRSIHDWRGAFASVAVAAQIQRLRQPKHVGDVPGLFA